MLLPSHVLHLLESHKEFFSIYQSLLVKWQKAINLVSSQSLADMWTRHILDSAQLFPFIENLPGSVGDMGSGAGFPGLVLAILALSHGAPHVHLVESDTRKCLFLQEVIRQTGAAATVHSVRLESYTGPSCNTWVARGFASVEKILSLSSSFFTPETQLILLKGEKFFEEIEEAQKKWHFKVEFYPSLTHAKGQIIVLTQVRLL